MHNAVVNTEYIVMTASVNHTAAAAAAAVDLSDITTLSCCQVVHFVVNLLIIFVARC